MRDTKEEGRLGVGAGAALVLGLTALAYAPALWSAGLHDWLTENLVLQHLDPHWPTWREGWTELNNLNWNARDLHRLYFRPVSASLQHLLVGRFAQWPGLYFGVLLALHAGSAALVHVLARRFGASPGAALLGAAVFAAHPSIAKCLGTGSFSEFPMATFLGLAGLLALWHARTGPAPRGTFAAGVALVFAAIWCEESFVALVPLWLLWCVARGEPLAAQLRRRQTRVLLAAAGVASLSQVAHWALTERRWGLNGETHAVTLVDRTLPLLVDSYLYLRRALVLFDTTDGSAWMASGGSDFADLSPYGPLAVGGTALVIGGLLLLARRAGQLRTVLLVAVGPAALALAVPVLARMQDISRWPGLRQVYFPAALLGLGAALVLAGLRQRGHLRTARAVALGLVAFVGWEAWQNAFILRRHWATEAARARFVEELDAALPRDLPRGARVYLLRTPMTTGTAGVWIQLRRKDPDLRVLWVSEGASPEGAEERHTRVDAHTLDVRLAPGASYPWLDDPPRPALSQRVERYLRTAGRTGLRPLMHPVRVPGTRFDVPATPGDSIEILETHGGVPSALRLRVARGLDDPGTLLLRRTPEGFERVR